MSDRALKILTSIVAVWLLALLVLGLTSCGTDAEVARFNAWVAGCTAEGGHISPTSFDSSGPRWWECFKDDQIVQVPGFENEDS